ncbi:hypothetical protein Trydic_g831 [Trypoxylus dichotomus]
MYRLIMAGTARDETLCQRAWPSQRQLSPLLSLSNDEVVRKYSVERNFFTKLCYKNEWKGESSIYFLRAATIKWYDDVSKPDKGTAAEL